jgi:hypothetical protein
MIFRYRKNVLGAAAMLALGASLVSAQVTKPTSTKRIPVSKDASGEVTPRVDTVTVTKYVTDTVRVNLPARVDTLRLTGNTVYRVDTVTVAPMVPPVRLPDGLYFGIGGGVMAPNGAIYNPNSAGPSAQAQLGWQGKWLGLRGDVNYAMPGEDSRFSSAQSDPDILNFSADVKLGVPFLTRMFGSRHRFGVYGIGGYTHTMFKNLPMRVDDTPTFIAGTNEWTHQNGWNAGAGASLMWSRTELFLESRVLSFKPTNAPQSRQNPWVLGINFY